MLYVLSIQWEKNQEVYLVQPMWRSDTHQSDGKNFKNTPPHVGRFDTRSVCDIWYTEKV